MQSSSNGPSNRKMFFTKAMLVALAIFVGVGVSSFFLKSGVHIYSYIEEGFIPLLKTSTSTEEIYVANAVEHVGNALVGFVTPFFLKDNYTVLEQYKNFNTTTESLQLKRVVFELPKRVVSIGLLESFKYSLPQKPNINTSALSYVAVNLNTGDIIVEKNKDVVLPIASITKLITGTVALSAIPLNNLVTINQIILNTDGNSGKLKLNEQLKASELMYPLLMVSSNDAAEALARSHDRSQFLKLMNNQVKTWGAKNTYFADPSGLSSRNVSTSEDLAKIVQRIYKEQKEIVDITKTKTKIVRGHTWTNPTHFLNLKEYQGGKNGYTDVAEETAVAIFEIVSNNGVKQPVAIIILRSKDRDKDILAILDYLKKEF